MSFNNLEIGEPHRSRHLRGYVWCCQRIVFWASVHWHHRSNFVTTSICAVSRASFFTGLYARCHGIHGFQTPLSDEQHEMSYPVRLRNSGYRTGFVGKYGVGGADDIDDTAGRYDFFRGFAGQGRYLVEGRAHMTEYLGDQCIEFLDGATADQPWNLSVSFKAPHVQDNVERKNIHEKTSH